MILLSWAQSTVTPRSYSMKGEKNMLIEMWTDFA